MPARTQKLYLFPDKQDQPSRVMGFPVWWDWSGFVKKFRERELDTGNPIYVDYAYLLTPGEAMAWDKTCRETYTPDFRSRHRNLAAEMQELAAALKESKWVIVESAEWESGLE